MIKLRHYNGDIEFGAEFCHVRDFLVRINQLEVVNEGFLWGRWEWMFCLRPFLDIQNLSCIGIWEDDGVIVALATYEQAPGNVWLSIDSSYNYLKKDMLVYAIENMNKEGTVNILVDDNDSELQGLCTSLGLRPTQNREFNSVIPINDDLHYSLPEGYQTVSLADDFNIEKYHRVLWKGFNHEGEPPMTSEALEARRIALSGPHINFNLNIAVKAPNGEFVSYCGMWYELGTDYALVEPVATDPDYRMKGMGRAAVLEAVKRCGELGAKRAYVGSSQQFYYNIGFNPCPSNTWWQKNNIE